jgi:hypothetical protein
MSEKNNWDWNNQEKLMASTLEWEKEKDYYSGNSTPRVFTGWSTEPLSGKAPSDWYEKIKFYLEC